MKQRVPLKLVMNLQQIEDIRRIKWHRKNIKKAISLKKVVVNTEEENKVAINLKVGENHFKKLDFI